MKDNIKSTLVLFCICAVVAVMMAVTNLFTAPIIKQNENAAANDALLVVMPEGKGFEKIDLAAYELPATVTEVYRETSGGGYVVKLLTTGYSQGLTVMCGVKADGTVSGATCLASGETLGYEKTFGESFVGKDMAGVESVDTISGATRTTGAYIGAVKDAINTVTILGGGSVDLRTEEEILLENLSAVLPLGEDTFDRLFFVEVTEGIDAVYTAQNGAGSVYVIGESFVGVTAEGAVMGESEHAAAVEAAAAILAASSSTEIDLSAYEGLPTALLSAAKTASGNYVLRMRGAGYGIQGEYHASGEYIQLTLSLTADGRIIDTLTTFQKETEGIGSVCGEEKFYGQFDGKTEETYRQVDAISGATVTTNGYLKAIERAFEALKILNGGGAIEE